MKIVDASFEILGNPNGIEMLKRIEYAGRTCYKSEDAITDESAIKFVTGLIQRGHEAMIEHQHISVKIVCDRGISHEIVRHRIGSYAQESTRYCNYSKEKFGNEITVIKPCFWNKEYDLSAATKYLIWQESCEYSEKKYFELLSRGATAQEARSVLPNSLKTEIVCTFNLREWIHFFKLRAVGITGKPHPQMLEITIPMLAKFKEIIPVIFDGLEVK
jgi:thymidylate synthase (FAD)